MRLSCNSIPLSPSLGLCAGQVVVVSALDGFTLCRDDAFERLASWVVVRQFQRQRRSLDREIGRFAARSELIGLRDGWLDDEGRATRVLAAIESGHLVGLRLRARDTDNDASRKQRLLARRITGHGRLVDGGQEYKLVVGVDLDGLSGRGHYEVVGRAEVTAVLERIAKQPTTAPELVPLLTEAARNLSPDWRPPSLPNGLVLLRRIALQVAAAEPRPVITPSQMRSLLEKQKPVEFFARFVDDHGDPVTDFVARFEHGPDPALDLPFAGPDFARMGDGEGPRQAHLTIADEARDELTQVLQTRWRAARGAPDPEWRQALGAKHELLRDIVVDERTPIAATLEDGKKHTFVFCPPVAFAHLHGRWFDTGRCFLLPKTIPALERLSQVCARYPDWDVVVIGHAASADTDADNMALSAERAEAVKACLTGDGDVWLAWYGDDVPSEKRWGRTEDAAMIDAVVPRAEHRSPNRARAYQLWHNRNAGSSDGVTLPEDGIMTAETRRQLVADYMKLSGSALPKDTRALAYACGGLYPLARGEGAPEDETDEGNHEGQAGTRAPKHTRIEVFFFGRPFGILPELPASSDGVPRASRGDMIYPEWRLRASYRHLIGGTQREILVVDELGQPFCGANVCVRIPEKEDIEVTSDAEGKIRVDVPDDCDFELVIDNVHEGDVGDSLKTASGQHFAEGLDKPEVEA